MMIKFVRFNIYLWLAVGLMSLATGCQTNKKAKVTATIELHMEGINDGAEDHVAVPIFRDHPIFVNMEKEFVIDGVDLTEAKVVDDLGGFKIKLQFNWRGTLMLDGITTANHGKRIGVLCTFNKKVRWLAAPVIQKQIANGVFEFTPDASREEADEIVKGLNDVVAKLEKEDKF
jgi:preprotein translocase subunit SecD